MRRWPMLLFLLAWAGCAFAVHDTLVWRTRPGPQVRTWYQSPPELEVLFSVGAPDADPARAVGPVRFSCIGFTQAGNYDLNRHFGYFMYGGWRHVGYIRDLPHTDIRYKYRTWNFTLGGGIKLGNMGRGCFFLGYAAELPFNYRERRFEDGDRVDRFSEWFSKRTPALSHAVLFGYQTPYVITIKCMVYLNHFHRATFSEYRDDATVFPYAGLDTRVVSLSLELGLFQWLEPDAHERPTAADDRDRPY